MKIDLLVKKKSEILTSMTITGKKHVQLCVNLKLQLAIPVLSLINSSSFEKSYDTDNILFAYRTLGHLFTTVDTASHMTALQDYTFDRRIPANFAYLFFA